jgi:putative transposase
MRFQLIDAAKEEFPVQRMCDVLGVSSSGYFAWRGRSACHRQQQDLIFLAFIRSAFAASHGTMAARA